VIGIDEALKEAESGNEAQGPNAERKRRRSVSPSSAKRSRSNSNHSSISQKSSSQRDSKRNPTKDDLKK